MSLSGFADATQPEKLAGPDTASCSMYSLSSPSYQLW